MRVIGTLAVVATAVCITSAAQAQVLNSPTGSALPAGVTPIGGIVADLIGLNGSRVVSQLAASALFQGFSDDGTPVAFRGNPLTIGIQTGFDASVLAALGGGFARVAFRVSLDDGDSSPGDFDFDANFFGVNGVEIGNFSAVPTVQTSSTGTVIGASGLGFTDSQLRTGFFFTDNAGLLSALFTALAGSNSLTYTLRDARNPGDNFYDFTQGIDGSLIDVGQGPVVTPNPGGTVVPEPSTMVLLATGLAAVAAIRRRRAA